MRPMVMRGILASLLSLALFGCDTDDDTAGITAQAPRTTLVTATTAEVADVPVWLRSMGRIQSRSAPLVGAEVSGRLTRVAVDTGDSVTTGQLLAETDTSALRLERQAAQAGIDRLLVHIANGERRVGRLETLASRSLSSQTQLDDAREQLEAFRADHKAAIAQLAIVEDSLAKSRVVAPIDAVVERRMVSTGDFVSRGQPLFELTQPEALQAWLPYPEALAMQVRIGQPVLMTSPLNPGQTIEGAITELQPSVGKGSRAVAAIIDLPEPGQLRPGATITGNVLVETRRSSVLVPAISVVHRPAGEVVYVIDRDMVRAQPVRTGLRSNGSIEIRSGLEGGERVVVDGAPYLTDGARIKLREPAP